MNNEKIPAQLGGESVHNLFTDSGTRPRAGESESRESRKSWESRKSPESRKSGESLTHRVGESPPHGESPESRKVESRSKVAHRVGRVESRESWRVGELLNLRVG